MSYICNHTGLGRIEQHPFGMVIEERSFSSVAYGFGFNGQEKDNEVSGTDGGHLAFNYRIHDARLCRFLSVDPLFKSYVYNSTYAFAENDVLRSIDIEGKERLNMSVTSHPLSDRPGRAKIRIELAYYVVSKGRGMVTDKMNPTVFHDKFAAGNTTLYMSELPSPNSEGRFLIGKAYRKSRKAHLNGRKRARRWLASRNIQYYNVSVEYNYSISEAGSFEDAVALYEADRQGSGIIFEPLPPGETFKEVRGVYADFMVKGAAEFRADSDVGGYGFNEAAHESMGSNENLILLNPNTTMTTSPESRGAHEAGHNSAKNFYHRKGEEEYGYYGYQMPGLSSRGEDVAPSQSNTIEIIKDETNRQTLTE